MTTSKVWNCGDLVSTVAGIFAGHGLPQDDADWIAYCLVEADLRGVRSHGIARIPIYTKRLRMGLVNPRPAMEVTNPTAASAHVMGDNGMGYLVGRRAIDEAIRLARSQGIGLVGASQSNHYGMSAIYMERAIEAGLASIALSNASPAMPVWGGRLPLLGTSPLAMAAPGGRGQPVLLDMATSVAAKGKIRRAQIRGETIPEGWAIDDLGRPTTDPEVALRGVVLPLGGPKGSGISLMIDVFAGVMSGAAFAGEVGNQNEDFDRAQNVGHFFIAWRPALFLHEDAYGARMDEMRTRLKAGPFAAGFDEILLPGEPEARLAAAARENGITLDGDELAMLEREREHAGAQ
ncbi:Ldh family oxidoreductase [Ensifer sp. SSB1]|jgi:LDH2 family malate/lactate/ureidoglycolate dehydrogenase|uniref:Ldh family oxidoreductase n=1 Tax=Ensifer sp. SSB1 TaxID=2795385 RepID=UPI001A43C22A|nr:Ldh family oxidoreductase [Ensifer sp. SSB1]MBK5570618.1 Ldh family oxidoreductase [Ensifer sp. SSB1]